MEGFNLDPQPSSPEEALRQKREAQVAGFKRNPMTEKEWTDEERDSYVETGDFLALMRKKVSEALEREELSPEQQKRAEGAKNFNLNPMGGPLSVEWLLNYVLTGGSVLAVGGEERESKAKDIEDELPSDALKIGEGLHNYDNLELNTGDVLNIMGGARAMIDEVSGQGGEIIIHSGAKVMIDKLGQVKKVTVKKGAILSVDQSLEGTEWITEEGATLDK